MSDDRVFGDVGTKLLLDNDKIRVWELHLEPGERSDLHHHEHDYLMVQIEGDEIAAQFEPDSSGTFAGADELAGPVSPGTAIFAEAGGMETAVNIGKEAFREVVVELKQEAPRRGLGALPVHHVSLNVDNVEASLPFYTEILGFELLPRPDFGVPGAWLRTANGVEIHLLEVAGFEPPSGPHVAFATDDIEAELERLKGLGLEVGDSMELSGTKQAFFSDPTGNVFELQQPAASA